MPDQAPPEQAKLAALAAAAAPLEPDAAERARLMALAADHVARFLTELPDMPAHSPWSPDGAEEGFTAAARPFEPLLRHIADQVDRPGMATASPRYMAYIPGGGLFASAIADFLAAAANKYAGYGPAAPGAVKLENDTVAWLAEVVGYPKTAAGVLTSGGSLATIAALTAARDAADEAGGGAVYLSGLTHHCVDKALHVIGRGRAPRRRIATDASGRMIPAALAAALAADAEAGVRPWLVVATAGATDTGAVDPLAEIAEICRRTGVWLHVDGAYGGLFRLCPEGEAVLAGIEQADSLVLDPHKTLFLPYGTGAALTRDGSPPDRLVRGRRQLPEACRDRGDRPLPRRPRARAHPSVPRAPPVAAPAARRRRGFPRRAIGEDPAGPAVARPPRGLAGLRGRPAAGSLGGRLPLPAEARRRRCFQ